MCNCSQKNYELLPELELEEEFEYQTNPQKSFAASRLSDSLDTSSLEFETPPSPLGCFFIGGKRKHVLNTKVEPFKFICKIEFLDSGGNVTGWCTGTLIRPNKVLTAAHCLYDRSRSAYEPTSARIVPGKIGPGRTRKDEPMQVVGTAVRFNVPDGYRTAANDDAAMPFDYGVITLREPIGKRIGFWTRLKYKPEKLLLEHKVNTAGYPSDSPNRPVVVYDQTVAVHPQTLEFLHDACKGQSGSPIWVRWQKYRAIVGIVTTSDDPNTPVVANTGVRLSPSALADIKRWISG